MARSKYPDISLAEVKKFCRHCVKVNGDQNRRYRLEYAGLAEENGSYYLVDGFRMVRFCYDLLELIHAEKKEIGSQPSMLYFIENAMQKCVTADKSAEIELPALEEVKAAADMNKAAVKRKEAELPFPLADGRIWVNPAYLLTMMQIFPLQRVAVMTGNAHQPIYFGCEGADGILMPMRCDKPHGIIRQWEERKARAEKRKKSVDGQVEQEKQEKSALQTGKLDNMGQPTNLAQLKKRLTVGAAFEIVRPGMDTEQRRVITAQSASICSIVPFEPDHRINKCGGSWLNWSKASYWRFEKGLCSVYYTQTDETQTESNLILSIRVLDTTAEEDEQYNTWLADMEAQQAAKQEQEKSDYAAQKLAEQEKQAQEIEDALTAAETAIFERGKRVNNNNIYGKCLVLRLAERYNVNVPLRTAGWIAKNLGYFIVGAGNTHEADIQIWSTKKTPQGVCDVLFAILHAVDAHFTEETEEDSEDMMTDEEVERFFNGGIVFPHSDSADDAQSVDTTLSDGVSAPSGKNPPLAPIRSNTAVSDDHSPIYGEYTQNLAGGHDTAPSLNTS